MSASVDARRRGSTLVLVVGWLVLVIAGMFALMLESFEPGDPALAPTRWPTDTTLRRAADRPTLVLVAHPYCSCTRATLAELGELMPRVRGRIDAQLLFLVPDGDLESARASSLWQQATAIEGLAVTADLDGSESARFGAETSGQAYLFRPDGSLAYEGGITPARGEQGDSAGRRSILALADGTTVDAGVGNVFGCALRDAAVGRFWLPSMRSAGAIGGASDEGGRDDDAG